WRMCSMDKPIVEYISRFKSHYPDLPNHLPEELEMELRDQLTGFWARCTDVRERYERGEITVPGNAYVRHALWEHVQPTEEELEAIMRLYVMLLAHICMQVVRDIRSLNRNAKNITWADIDELLPLTWPAFIRCMQSFDSDSGTRISTWVGLDLRTHIRALWNTLACGEGRPDLYAETEAYEPEDAGDIDIQSIINDAIEDWA